MDDKKIVPIKCESCGAPLEVGKDKPIGHCQYCGAKYDVSALVKDDKDVELAKISFQAYKETEEMKHQYEMNKIKQEREWQEKQQNNAENREKANLFKKSKLRILIIVFLVIFVLGAAVAFNNGKTLAAIIAIAQIALAVFAWLTGSGIVKFKISGLHIVATILSIILIVPYIKANSYKPEDKPVSIMWEDMTLGEVLPDPPSNMGHIIDNSSERLSVEITDMSEKQYNDYKKVCIEKGFDVDKDESGSNFTAFNNDGYKLSLDYRSYSEEIRIDIEAPTEMGTIGWPDSEVGKIIPVPKSNTGKFSYERSDGFFVEVGNMTIDDYNAYVNECSSRGFDIDYQKGDDYYYAYNKDGYYLSLNYCGNNIISVKISAPKKSEETAYESSNAETTKNAFVTEITTVPETESTQTASTETKYALTDSHSVSTGIRPEIKDAMDNYEAFYDEYIAFMKKYQTAGATDMLSMLSDYNDFIEREEELLDKIDKIQNDLNDEELAYYFEVIGRVEKKLLELI